jgi:universal stress protein A
MLPLRTVLCPLDFSDASYKALRTAADVASHFQAKLIIAHVIPAASGIPSEPMYVFEGPQGYQQEQETAAEERLAVAAKQQLPSELESHTAIGRGDAANEIARLATAEGADLIVIATHGLTGWRHLVFGSVAEKVIHETDRPVLVIPARDLE